MTAQHSHSGLTTLGLTVILSFFVLCADPASAQSKTAAGVIIIQNNQMRKELQETKAELKAIREGLGIESGSVDAATSPRSESELIMLQAVGSAAAILLLIPAVLALSYVMRKQKSYLAAGDIDKALASTMLRAIIPPLGALLLLPFFALALLRLFPVPILRSISVYSAVQLWVLGFFAWIAFVIFCGFSRTKWRRQLLRKAKELRQRSAAV
jgi:hypothetical protein